MVKGDRIMKKLIMVTGTMGIGKNDVCKKLYRSTDRSVWLDGDWCWKMNPWVFDEECKIMVENNITYLIRSYLSNSNIDAIVFSWAIHNQEILDKVLHNIDDIEHEEFTFTLTCDPVELESRMTVKNWIKEDIEKSLYRMKMYEALGDTVKIDVTHLTIYETAKKISEISGLE